MATVTKPTDGAQTLTLINLVDADTPYTLDRNLCPCRITNVGATGAITVNLPADCKGGEEVRATVRVAQDIILAPGAAGVITGPDGTAYGALATGKAIIGDALGEKIHMVATAATTWEVLDHGGLNTAGQFNEEQA